MKLIAGLKSSYRKERVDLLQNKRETVELRFWEILSSSSMGWKDPWKAWQPTPVFLAGESPWTEEPGGLQYIGSQRVRHD